MTASSTHEIFVEPCALVVALPDEHIVLCHEVLGQAGLRVHRHEHPQIAADRIAKLMPRVVVLDASLPTATREMVEDRAIAIGAVLVLLQPSRDYAGIERQLSAAVFEIRERFGRRAR